MAEIEVLIVDDSEYDRESIGRQLNRAKQFDCRVLEAEDGAACLELLRGGSRPDCILLDYSLPGQDGIRVLAEIMEHDPLAAVVMIASEGNENVAVEAMKVGAYDYLVKKDIHADLVGHTIGNVIGRAAMARELHEQQENLAEFARVLVHDLQAPLRSIRMRSEMLRESLPPDALAAGGQHLDAMHRASDRLQQLILSLRSYTEADAEEPVWGQIPLLNVIGAVQLALAPVLAETGAQLTADADLPNVPGDEPQIQQLFQNLVANGIKYNESDLPAVHISATTDDTGVTVTVRDNGIGVDPAHHERIFEPFKRLHGHATYEGTGLGLATCRKIATRHRGRLWCESRPGEGAAFHLLLPIGKVD